MAGRSARDVNELHSALSIDADDEHFVVATKTEPGLLGVDGYAQNDATAVLR
ncbi:MAG TPA: hypothetical protein VHC69_02740 [Polyangiaceae bacterium]|nr:hypothetical protein [Polyangiaceae bacterium]